MSSTYGENLKLSIFGQSHGAGIGMVLDGIPAGLHVDMQALDVLPAAPRGRTIIPRPGRRRILRNSSPVWWKTPPAAHPLRQ